LAHRFLNITDFESLMGHSAIGASWEGFIIENILNRLSDKWRHSYYRTNTQAEIDLILKGPKKEIWPIEIKRSTAPKVSKCFHYASEDIKATRKFVIYSGTEQFPLPHGIEAMGLIEFLQRLKNSLFVWLLIIALVS
jgi:predicted AAA+ superfamily ATPase